jgi:hypothetical protein
MGQTLRNLSLLGIVAMLACSSNVKGLRQGPSNGNLNNGLLRLSVIGSQSLKLGYNKPADLQVQLMLGDQPVAGGTIFAAIEGAAGGAILGTNTALTDDGGIASMRLIGGNQAARFSITFSTEGADNISLDVEVDGKYLGQVEVRMRYTGPVKPFVYEVRLHDVRRLAGCTNFNPNEIRDAVDMKPVDNVNLPVLFANMQDKQQLVATVIAKSASNRVVAYGCAGPSTVVGQRNTIINVNLDTAEPDMRGTYAFGQTVRPLEFVQQNSTLWVVATDIRNIMVDPLTALTGVRTDAPMTNTGGFWLFENGVAVRSGLCYLFDEAGPTNTCVSSLPPILNAVLEVAKDNVPVLANALNAIKDSANIITAPRFAGDMIVNTYDKSNGNVSGELRWNAYNFVFRWDCAESSDPCCGHRIFDGGTPPLNLTIMSTPFNGNAQRVQSATELKYTLQMDEANIGLAYGSLALTLLEQVIFAELLPMYNTDGQPGVTMLELFQGIFSCSSLTGTERTICDAATSTLAGPNGLLTRFIGTLQFSGTNDWNVKQRVVNAELTDTDLDLQTDEMRGTVQMRGTFSGAVTQTSDEPFFGKFEGTKCESDNACGAGSACRFGKNPADKCFARNYCGPRLGTRNGFESCLSNIDCVSGTCMQAPTVSGYSMDYPGRCFQACTNAADCAGNGTCDTDGYVSVEGFGSFPSPDDEVTYAGTCVR